MRTLRVIGSLSPRVGGPPQSSALSAIAALQAGIRVDVAAVVDRADGDSGLAARLRQAGAGFLPFARDPAVPRSREWAVSRHLVSWLARRAPSYDIVHVHGAWLASTLAAVLAARRRRVPVVMTPHESLTRFDIEQSRLAPAKRALIRLYSAAGVHPIYSSQIEAGASALQVGSQFILFHPVEPPGWVELRGPRERGAEGLTVGFLGRVHPKKNLAALLSAVESTPGVRLLVAGDSDTDHGQALRARFARLEAGRRVSWLGFVDRDGIGPLLERIDLLALPSHFECFGMAAAEAMASGVPVLVSSSTGISELVARSRSGWVCETSAPAIATALGEVAALHPDALADHGRLAREAAAGSLSLATHGAQLAQIYRRILSAAADGRR